MSDNDQDGDSKDMDMHGLHDELHELSFAQLQKVRERIGSKKFRELFHKDGGQDAASEKQTRKRRRTDIKPGQRSLGGRANKNRPREESSKQRVPRIRQVVPVHKQKSRDPRFDDISGTLNQDMFEKSFKFLETKKAEEQLVLRKELKRVKNTERKEELKQLLQSMRDKESSRKAKAKQREVKAKRRNAERALIAQGKKPFFLKKSDEKKLALLQQYETLEKHGKLKKVLTSRRKHQTSKVKGNMPQERRER